MANRYASTVAEDPLEGTTGAMNPPQPGHERSAPTTTPLETKPREPEPDVDEGDNAAVAPPEQELTQWLRAQNAEISQLAGGLAHEIRNPLSTLSLNLDLLDEDFQEAESPRDRRIKQRVGRLKREVQRLYDVLENFLRFARVQELKLASTDLNALVEELCDFYEPQATTLGIVVRTYFAPDLPWPVIDADLFKQAVLNLMLNAEHAMAEGGELIMTTRRDGAWIVLDVIDTGAGMPEDVQARIFDPFYSTRPGGSGLGLPTTRKIVEAHGGTIEVDSVPGKGSRFSLRLPVPSQPDPSTPDDPLVIF
jgi:two-component system, NtrC family, sensor histidine kinase HydH